jgi:hypothetical protein
MDQPAEEAGNFNLVDIADQGLLCVPRTRPDKGRVRTRAWVRHFPRLRLKLLSSNTIVGPLGWEGIRNGGWPQKQINTRQRRSELASQSLWEDFAKRHQGCTRELPQTWVPTEKGSSRSRNNIQIIQVPRYFTPPVKQIFKHETVKNSSISRKKNRHQVFVSSAQ